MRILLSVYACEPEKGSEPGVGWHWAVELAGLGHEVEVITRSSNRNAIEKALANAPVAGLCFHYCDLPAWAKWWKRGNHGIHLYYWLWQRCAYRLAKGLTQQIRFDLVHHLTFGVFRQPSLMGRLGLPFVVGPIGGGEVRSRSLRGSFPVKAEFEEILREASNKLAFWNPSLPAMFRHATVIFCKTPETQAILPARDRAKSLVQLEIGLEPHRIWQGNTARVANADFLYAGRLLYWKGVHLALKALSELRRERPDATLTVIGTGTDEAKLRKLAVALELRDSVRWLGWVPQEQIWAHYRRYTAFVFPSMHDSSGNVLLEAMSQALPVICLDTGGPGAILPTSCGIKVPVEYQSEAEVVSALSAAMLRIADHPELRVQMGRRALEAARESTWGNVVFNSYAHVEQALAASATHGMNRPNQGKQWRNAL